MIKKGPSFEVGIQDWSYMFGGPPLRVRVLGWKEVTFQDTRRCLFYLQGHEENTRSWGRRIQGTTGPETEVAVHWVQEDGQPQWRTDKLWQEKLYRNRR